MKKYIFAVMMILANPTAWADCQPGPGVNCVDLCRMDPGNRLNSTDHSETEISRSSGNTCRTRRSGYEPSEPGVIIVVRYKVVHYSICSAKWYESIVTRSFCQAGTNSVPLEYARS